MVIRRVIVGCALGLAVSGMVADPADAGLMLSLESAGVTQTVSDTDGDGAVGYFGTVGDFDLNMSVGLSKPSLGSAARPYIDFASVNATTLIGGAPRGGTLTATLSDTGFAEPLGLTAFSIGVGGGTAGSLAFDYYLDLDDDGVVDPTSVLLASLSAERTLSFAESARAKLDLTGVGTYGLITVATITHSADGHSSSFNSTIRVAEPATLGLLGLGLLGLGLGTGRRSTRAA